MSRIPLHVETRESVADGQLGNNILKNIELIPAWVQEKYIPHATPALMISAGHSWTKVDQQHFLDKHYDHPRDRSLSRIFTVKHALPLFENTSYRPDYCVALDPRPIDGVSTLGTVRKDLYKIYPETTYLVASMIHPSVVQYLLDGGAKVVGWHSYCAGSEDPRVKELGIPSWVYGGSSSSMRAISLARIFGFRDMTLLGYDTCFSTQEAVYHLTKDKSKKLKDALRYIEDAGIVIDFQAMQDRAQALRLAGRSVEELATVNYLTNLGYNLQPPKGDQLLPLVVGGFKSWVSGEMAAVVQDLESLFKNNNDISFTNLSGGFCKALFDQIGPKIVNPVDFFGKAAE